MHCLEDECSGDPGCLCGCDDCIDATAEELENDDSVEDDEDDE